MTTKNVTDASTYHRLGDHTQTPAKRFSGGSKHSATGSGFTTGCPSPCGRPG